VVFVGKHVTYQHRLSSSAGTGLVLHMLGLFSRFLAMHVGWAQQRQSIAGRVGNSGSRPTKVRRPGGARRACARGARPHIVLSENLLATNDVGTVPLSRLLFKYLRACRQRAGSG
jgi:hypothetical protein